MNQHNIVMTDELKSIYFKHQNTVLTDEAEIHTSDFSSLAIEAIKTLVDNTPDLLPDMLGRRLNVVLCEQSHINTVLEANQEELQPLALDDDKQSEVALRVR
ncbi:hypothetical protein BEI47_019815, partial [Aliivibrio fischeri]